MSEKVEHTPMPWERDGRYFLAPIPSAMPNDKREVARFQFEADAVTAFDAVNSYPALLAERDRLREALKEISDIKPERIADTEFTTGPLAHFQAAQRIARAVLKDTNQ